ncbi:MAG TPA: sigma-70 family RNA polymerase sigma factor [Actinomycetales bacterium]|nr:sigma-70 family RNA polymerase sigma factor [Actinomycetales bacterium]
MTDLASTGLEISVDPAEGTDVDHAFMQQVEPLRRELTAHCYRMLGSVHDAEDLVQETYLRAWRAFHGFDHRSSLRTWMYKIATNVCLTALKGRERRPLPTGLGAPPGDPTGALDSRPEITWLEPLPDAMVWADADPDPADTAVSRESVRLAFVAALQHLTAQQRAVLILRDVLAWRAAEVADALDISVAAANSTLQRARAHVEKLAASPESRGGTVPDQRSSDLLTRYVAAFENYDIDALVHLLTQDAVWEMPPFTGWYSGSQQIASLISTQCPASGAGDMRMVRTSANGQPVLALYMRDLDGVHRAFQLQQLTVEDDRVTHVVCYFDTSLFAAFGLADELPRSTS